MGPQTAWCCSETPLAHQSAQKRAGSSRLGVHLFPHDHSLYSVRDHPNFRAVFYPLATRRAAIRRSILPNNRFVRWLSANNSQ